MPDQIRSLALLLLVFAAPAAAQFSQLTATDDGAQLYFTSQVLLKGGTPNPATPFPEARLFRAAAGVVTLFAERGTLAAEGSGSNSAGVLGPRVTGDGTLVGFSFVDICPADPECISPGTLAEIRGQKTIELGPGTVQLSRNGHWALVTNLTETDTPPAPPVDTYTSTLIDLTTGARTDVPPPPFGAINTVASDGTLLVQPAGGPISLWKQGQLTSVPLPPGAGRFLLSDDASTLFYTGYWAPDFGMQPLLALIASDLSSGLRALLYLAPPDNSQMPIPMAASNNGRTSSTVLPARRPSPAPPTS